MAKITQPLRILSGEQMGLIHQTALRILHEVGMRIKSHEALDYLEATGCRVDHDNMEVRFPPSVVQKWVDRMRSDYADTKRLPDRMQRCMTQIYFSIRPYRVWQDFTVHAGGTCCFIYDLEDRRRPPTMEDARAMIALADGMENVDFITPPIFPHEIPAPMRPIIMAAELAKHTRKLGGIEAWDRLDVQYITRIAEVVAGGPEALRKHPVLIGYAEARSPLCLDRNMAEVLMEYVKLGLPQSLDTMPCGGSTAPVTFAGTLALGVAETLGGLVLGYAVDEHAVMSVDVTPGLLDMRTGLFPFASPDRILLVSATVQMLTEYYGRPGGCHGGKTDACHPGVQAGVEKLLSMLFPLLAGSTGIGTMGQLENTVTFSPQQLVIDNEIAGLVRYMLRGIEVAPETLALDVIREVGIGGQYLDHPHTATTFRKERFLSGLFERLPWQAAAVEELKGIEEKARDKAKKLMKREYERPLTKEQEQDIDEIVAEACQRRAEGASSI